MLNSPITATFGGSQEETFVNKTYSHASEVVVPPTAKVVKKASITRATLAVPWSAVVKTGVGRLANIDAMWFGESTYDFQVTSEESFHDEGP